MSFNHTDGETTPGSLWCNALPGPPPLPVPAHFFPNRAESGRPAALRWHTAGRPLPALPHEEHEAATRSSRSTRKPESSLLGLRSGPVARPLPSKGGPSWGRRHLGSSVPAHAHSGDLMQSTCLASSRAACGELETPLERPRLPENKSSISGKHGESVCRLSSPAGLRQRAPAGCATAETIRPSRGGGATAPTAWRAKAAARGGCQAPSPDSSCPARLSRG